MDLDFRNSFARWYFYITPVFILLDYFWGLNIRIAALDAEPSYKNLYYGLCILCGVLMYIIPRVSALIAFIESLINLVMLLLIIILPYMRIITTLTEDALGADFKALQESFSVDSIINIFIVVLCITITLRTSVDRMSRTFNFNQSDTE